MVTDQYAAGTARLWSIEKHIQDAAHNWGVPPPWFRDVYDTGKIIIAANQIHVRTREGVMTANSDDWVICGVKAEVYPCNPDIFAETYEPA